MTKQQTLDLINALEKACNEKIRQVKEDYDKKIEIVKKQYVTDNAEFKTGDFVGNVTGIIKVESIHCLHKFDMQIVYSGIRYHKSKGFLIKNRELVHADYLQSYVRKIEGAEELQIID